MEVATSRHRRDMTERLLKATLSPNQTNKQNIWEWQHAFEILLLPSFLYILYNEDGSLACPCVLAEINRL